jgi:hypothetical protein
MSKLTILELFKKHEYLIIFFLFGGENLPSYGPYLRTANRIRTQNPETESVLQTQIGSKDLITKNFNNKKQLNTINILYQSFSSLADREMEEYRFLFHQRTGPRAPILLTTSTKKHGHIDALVMDGDLLSSKNGLPLTHWV